MFFVCVYIHIARGLYYGSYTKPRVVLWTVGVVIFFMMFATAFIGYVLPWGQMSFWGGVLWCLTWLSIVYSKKSEGLAFIRGHVKAKNRVGPHSQGILSIIIGSLLGDAYAEQREGNTRIAFHQEKSHQEYAHWLHGEIASRGYCNPVVPEAKTRVRKDGKLRYIVRFYTWTFSSFNWIREMFYDDRGIKVVPANIGDYLTPLALAIWIQDDGGKVSTSMKIATNSFTKEEVDFLCKVLMKNFGIYATTQSAGYPDQYNVYISVGSMPLISEICKPYTHPSMYYKYNGYMK